MVESPKTGSQGVRRPAPAGPGAQGHEPATIWWRRPGCPTRTSPSSRPATGNHLPPRSRSLASALHISLDEMFDAMGRRPAEANPAATASSGWTPNRNYSAGGSGAGNLRGVSTVASAPAAPAPDTMAPLPRYEAAADGGASADGIIAEVMDVLAALSPQEQLEAVAEVQARVIQAVIDDRVARGRRRS